MACVRGFVDLFRDFESKRFVPLKSVGCLNSFFPVGILNNQYIVMPLTSVDAQPVRALAASAKFDFIMSRVMLLKVMITKDLPVPGFP